MKMTVEDLIKELSNFPKDMIYKFRSLIGG